MCDPEQFLRLGVEGVGFPSRTKDDPERELIEHLLKFGARHSLVGDQEAEVFLGGAHVLDVRAQGPGLVCLGDVYGERFLRGEARKTLALVCVNRPALKLAPTFWRVKRVKRERCVVCRTTPQPIEVFRGEATFPKTIEVHDRTLWRRHGTKTRLEHGVECG